MKIITKTYQAKNHKGQVLLVRELTNKRVEKAIDDELSSKLIEDTAKEISEFNKDADTFFLDLTTKGDTGFIERKFLEE